MKPHANYITKTIHQVMGDIFEHLNWIIIEYMRIYENDPWNVILSEAAFYILPKVHTNNYKSPVQLLF